MILRQKLQNTHQNKYDYSSVDWINTKNHIDIICPKHGHFKQNAGNHLRGQGCLKCKREPKITTKDIIDKLKNVYGNLLDYTNVVYKPHEKIKLRCIKHNYEYEQKIDSSLKYNGCVFCNVISKGEIHIQKFLEQNSIKFIKQFKFKDCKNILPLSFDFYLPELNICIEFDGKQHFEPVKWFGGDIHLQKTQVRDNIKTKYCHDNNIQLIRIKYSENIDDILNNLINSKYKEQK